MKDHVVDGQFDDSLSVATAVGVYEGAYAAIVNADGTLPDSAVELYASDNSITELANRHNMTSLDELRPVLNMAAGTVNAYELKKPAVKTVTPTSPTEATVTID